MRPCMTLSGRLICLILRVRVVLVGVGTPLVFVSFSPSANFFASVSLAGRRAAPPVALARRRRRRPGGYLPPLNL